MAGDDLTDEVLRFLADRVDNFEELEALLLLHGAPKELLTGAEIASRTGLPTSGISSALDALVQKGFVWTFHERGTQTFQIHVDDAADLRSLDALAATYRITPTGVLRAMSRLAFERIRSSGARAFADAFRLAGPRREKK